MIRINRWSDEISCPENYPILITGDEVWITRDNKEILVKDMTNAHLNNCLQFVKNKDTYWELVFLKEIEKRYISDEQRSRI